MVGLGPHHLVDHLKQVLVDDVGRLPHQFIQAWELFGCSGRSGILRRLHGFPASLPDAQVRSPASLVHLLLLPRQFLLLRHIILPFPRDFALLAVMVLPVWAEPLVALDLHVDTVVGTHATPLFSLAFLLGFVVVDREGGQGSSITATGSPQVCRTVWIVAVWVSLLSDVARWAMSAVGMGVVGRVLLETGAAWGHIPNGRAGILATVWSVIIRLLDNFGRWYPYFRRLCVEALREDNTSTAVEEVEFLLGSHSHFARVSTFKR